MIGYSITDIEDAIISTLKNDVNIKQYVRSVDRMPLENKALIKKLIFNYPAMIAMYIGGTDNSSIYPMVDHTGNFAIWCIDKSVRKANDASVGVYQMLNDLLFALHGNNLGLDIISTLSTGISFEDADEKITIYSRDFQISWRYQ